MGKKWNEHTIMVRKPELARPRSRSVDNIKMNLGKIGQRVVDSMDLNQDRN
jgi:hypothetical protein